MHSTSIPVGRRAFGLAVVGALALSACGSDDTAGFDVSGGSDGGGGGSDSGGASDGGTSDGGGEIPANLPRLDAGFTAEGFTKDVTVTATMQPTNSTVVTPTGTLTIAGLQEIATVPADALELDAERGADGEELDYAAAEGEVLRALDLSFTPFGEDSWSSDDDLPLTDLSLSATGTQTHLAEITRSYEERFLLSVPEDGSGRLIVSSEGHDQVVDLFTGEREEDEVAAAYYRGDRVQEPHHTFPVPVDPYPVLYDGKEDSEIVPEVSFQATTLTLTAWTKEKGWAEPGRAWLVLDWISECSLATEVPGLVDVGEYAAVATVDVDGETTTDKITLDKVLYAPSTSTEESTLVVPVAVDMAAATISMSGSLSLSINGSRDSYELDGSGDREFSSEPLTVEFSDAEAATDPQPSDGGS